MLRVLLLLFLASGSLHAQRDGRVAVQRSGVPPENARLLPCRIPSAPMRDTVRATRRALSVPFRTAFGVLGGYAVAGALAIANQQGEIASNASILTIGVPLGASLIAPAPRLASRCSRERRYAWSLAGAVAGAGLGYLAGAGTRASAERIQFRTGAGGLIGVIAGAELCR